MGLSPENEFVLRVLRSHSGRGQMRIEESLPLLDWTKVVSVAKAQDLFPIFYHVLSHQGLLEVIPPSPREEIEEGYLESTASTLCYDDLLKEILPSFHRGGLPFVILKGPSMALEFYHPRETRPYRDLDLLIKTADFEQARNLLSGLDFRVTDPDRETHRRRYFNSVGFFRKRASDVHLDLHWETLMISWNRRPFLSSSKVWEEIRWLEYSGMELPVLQPQTLIPYLCIHFAFHHQFGKLLTLCDLDLAIQKFGREVDWEEIVWQSREMMIRKPVHHSLMLAASLLETEVPGSVLRALGKGQIGGKLFPLNYLIFREKPLNTNVERLAKFVLIDGLPGKIQSLVTFYRQR